MSMTSGLIAIKGQHLDKLNEIFDFYQMIDTQEDQSVESWDEALAMVDDLQAPAPGDTSEKHVVWFDKGWTLIEDITLLRAASNCEVNPNTIVIKPDRSKKRFHSKRLLFNDIRTGIEFVAKQSKLRRWTITNAFGA